jgi:biopolymer transport protein ExbD
MSSAEEIRRPPPIGNSVSRAATIRRLRTIRRREDHIEVDLSPLIDCVFLLLIFFLVTTMLKKLEKQIPVVLPDYTSSLAAVAESPSIIYSLDEDGNLSRAQEKKRTLDGLRYQPVESFAGDLKSIAVERGNKISVRIDTDRDVPVQKVIDVLDVLAIQGFENVGVRLRHRKDQFFELEDVR